MEKSQDYPVNECGRPELFIPPPYCRKAENRKNGTECGDTHSLKLTVSNPSKLLLLCKTLTDCSSKALEIKFNNYLMKEGECKCSFLLHFFPKFHEAVVQTLGQTELETSIRFPISEDEMNQLIKYQNFALKCDVNLPQIRAIFEELFNDLAYTIVAVPILKKQQYYPCSIQPIQPIFLTCFVDSKKHEDYLIKLSHELFKYCLPVLVNTLALEEEKRQKRQYQSLVTVIKNLIESLGDINELIKMITDEARKISYASKGSLFLNNSDQAFLISNVFNAFSGEKSVTKVKTIEKKSIPDKVVSTGQLINIQEGYEYPRWMTKSLSEYTGFDTKNLLCFPLKNNEETIGVVQVCNRKSGIFSCFDEEITSLLGVFCGSLITHSIKYSERENFRLRNHLSSQIFLYQIQVDEEEDVINKVACPLIHLYPDFNLFSFIPRIIATTETVCLVLKMFEELNYFTTFRIARTVFLRFVAHVKSGCRNVPYHNWKHLFSTTHFAYLCLKKLKLVEMRFITKLEALAYFMSCLCHDVDYRGTQNPFQENSSNALASLYSSFDSVIETHRLSQVFRILQIEGCNFLEFFDQETYNLFLSLMKDFVLATDIATHPKLYKRQYNMVKNGYNRNDPEHRYCFMALMVTVADLSDFTKNWIAVREVSTCLLHEFFTKDSEERDKISLADLLIDFLKKSCLPPYILAANLFTTIKSLVHIIKKHILYWEASKHIFERALNEGISNFKILTMQGFDESVEATVRFLEEEKNSFHSDK